VELVARLGRSWSDVQTMSIVGEAIQNATNHSGIIYVLISKVRNDPIERLVYDELPLSSRNEIEGWIGRICPSSHLDKLLGVVVSRNGGYSPASCIFEFFRRVLFGIASARGSWGGFRRNGLAISSA
jgi:hypothetical protein